MASGSTSRARGSGAPGSSSQARAAGKAPSADDALLTPKLNPTFVAMSAADLVAHLNRFRRAEDFVDAAVVFAARERKLAEAEGFARAADERVNELLDAIQAGEYKIRRAAETEVELRAKIRALQLGAAALISSGIGGGGLAQHAAGPVPQDFMRAMDDATGVQTIFAQGGVGGDVPTTTMRDGALNRAAPHLVTAPPPSTAALFSSSIIGRGVGLTQQAAGCSREPVPQDFVTASDDATGVQTMVARRSVVDVLPMKKRPGALNRPALLVGAPLPSATATARISSAISGRGLTQQAAACSREPVAQDFTTASDAGVQTTVAQRAVGDDVPMKMRPSNSALNRPAPHLVVVGSPLPSAATLMSSSISGRGAGLTQQAVGCSREPVPQDFITANDDAATGVQTTVTQGEVRNDVPMKKRHGALNRAAPHLAAGPLPASAAALISSGSGISGRGLTQKAAAGHGGEPVRQDFIRASDDATKVQTILAAKGGVGGDVPMKMKHRALNRAAPHLAAPVPSAAAALISSGSGITGRGLTQQAAGHGGEPVGQDFIRASDDATEVQTILAAKGGVVGADVPMKMKHRALNRAAPHLAVPVPSAAAAVISSGISGRGLTHQAAVHGHEPVPQDCITTSDNATGVQTMVTQGEVGDDVPKKMRNGPALNRDAPRLVVAAPAPLPASAAAVISSSISERGLTPQQAAGHGREAVPQDFITAASDDGVGFDDATGVVQTMFADVGDNIPRPSSPARRIGAALPAASSMSNDELAERTVEWTVVDADVRSSHQVAKAGAVHSRDKILEAVAGKRKQKPAVTSASKEKEKQPLMKKLKTAAPHLVADDPLPDTLIDDDDERAAELVATDVLSCNEEAQGGHEVSEDNVPRARVTAGHHKVSEEEAQGEDVAASHHRRSQEGEQQAARPTKKARRLKGASFYNEVFKALKKKQELLKKREDERLAKAAAAASKQQLQCKCWWSDAPYRPSKSQDVVEDSSDDSQN